jgi:hypothetical protein
MAAFVAEHAPGLPFPMRAEPAARHRRRRAGDHRDRVTDAAGLPGSLAPGAVVCSMGSHNEDGVMEKRNAWWWTMRLRERDRR